MPFMSKQDFRATFGTTRMALPEDTDDLDMEVDPLLLPDEDDEAEVSSLPMEEQLFHYVSSGNVNKLTALLDRRIETGLDINVKNSDGMTPLGIAIREGFLIMVYKLLDQNARVGDAFLRAVDGDFQQAVNVLIEYTAGKSIQERDNILKCRCETNDMHPDVTPIVRAAQKNNFTLVKILYDIGLRIPEIHADQFETSATDSLQRSVGTLEVYRGLASPAYVCFSTPDPIARAFKLCSTLRKIGLIEVEFKLSYIELSDIMEQYAADLVSYARNTEEIMTILAYHGSDSSASSSNGDSRSLGLLPTVNKAIAFEQKKFVAQPNCQQAVRTQFYQRLHWLNEKPGYLRLLYQVLITLLYPILSLVYKLGLSTKCDDFIKIPIVKFLMQFGSDLSLLTVVLYEVRASHGELGGNSGGPIAPTYIFLFIYALGMLWREILCMYKKGKAETLSSVAHFVNVFIGVLLVVVFFLQVIIHAGEPIIEVQSRQTTTASPTYNISAHVHPSLDAEKIQEYVDNFFNEVHKELNALEIDLDEWSKEAVGTIINKVLKPLIEENQSILNTSDPEYASAALIYEKPWFAPMLLSKAFIGLAAVISFTRIQPYLVASDKFGPLQISLKSMIATTSRFLVVVVAVLLAFATGLTYIYTGTYDIENMEGCDANQVGLKRGSSCADLLYFDSIIKSMFTLYWSLFGLMPREAVQNDVMPSILESAGTLLYASFYIFSVVVLLNALIAVMSNVYNVVEENADVEWKFNRTALWMSFLDETFSVPPPFNLLPRRQSVWCNLQYWSKYLLARFHRKFKCCTCSSCLEEGAFQNKVTEDEELKAMKRSTSSNSNSHKVDDDGYKRIITRMVDRYIADRTSHERNLEGDITVADLRNLKNDVVGLRYELFKQMWQINEKLETEASESSNIKDEMNHVNRVFERLDKNNEELSEYQKEVSKWQNVVAKRLAKLPMFDASLDDWKKTTEEKIKREHARIGELGKKYEGKDEQESDKSPRRLRVKPFIAEANLPPVETFPVEVHREPHREPPPVLPVSPLLQVNPIPAVPKPAAEVLPTPAEIPKKTKKYRSRLPRPKSKPMGVPTPAKQTASTVDIKKSGLLNPKITKI